MDGDRHGPTIRRAVAADAGALLVLWRAAEATPSPTDDAAALRRLLAEPAAAVLVAERGGELVGSLIAGFDGWRGNLYRLATHPVHRRRGVARALVAEAEAWLRARGARRVTALVERDHAWAAAFWAAVGYGEDARMARYVRNLG
ncbi:MAG TPA: GNAT family N-acetyltransferase [Chloroflexota bacterium]|nr:GNAT family N-acetyltransferase [Chloroflexota bacterium]